VSFNGKIKEKKHNTCPETGWNNETHDNNKSIFGESITANVMKTFNPLTARVLLTSDSVLFMELA